jgi:isopenicillin N synthase-like dioxygenase
VVNIGDLLMRWTNDRWLSNLHRVVNPPADHGPSEPRLSIAFFNHPNCDVLIECIAPPGRAAHPPVPSGDYRDLKYALASAAAEVPGPARAALRHR